MEVNREDLDNNKVQLKVEVEPEKVNKALEQAYRKVVKDVSIPGFRKGKVPRKVLEAKYGKEVLHKDALDILIPETYTKAVKETEIEPIARPDIDDLYIAEDETATYTATVEVKPEVTLGEYKGLGVEKEEVELKDEEVEQQLENIQSRYSQLINSDKEEVEDGDYVIIDFEGTIDGETFPGGSAEEFTLEIGSGKFVPGFEEKLIGMKVGETNTIQVTMPEDYNAEDLAGKTVDFEVSIKEIKEINKPEIDDELAKQATDFDTIEELRENIRENLQTDKEGKAEEQFKTRIVEKAVENAEVDVPGALIEQEADKMLQNLSMGLSQQGMELEDYFEYMDIDEEGWRERNHESAARMARNNLVLEAIAKNEGIEITDEELDKKIEDLAEQSEQDPKKVKMILQMQGQLEDLKEGMLVEKTIDFLVENN